MTASSTTSAPTWTPPSATAGSGSWRSSPAQEFQWVFSATKRTGPGGGDLFGWAKTERRVGVYYFYVLDPEFGPGSSRSAPTSRIRPRCGSTATSGPNAKPTGPGRLHRVGQRVRRLRPARRAAGDLRPVRARRHARASSTAGSRSSRPRSPPTDRAAGYWWELSMRQVEVSRTLVFDDPRRARGFFEALVADNVGIGRPEAVAVVFGPPGPPDRPRTPTGPGSSRPAPR